MDCVGRGFRGLGRSDALMVGRGGCSGSRSLARKSGALFVVDARRRLVVV